MSPVRNCGQSNICLAKNMDYAVWERDKSMLQKFQNQWRLFFRGGYKGCYAYASTGFVDWLGYDRPDRNIWKNGVIIE